MSCAWKWRGEVSGQQGDEAPVHPHGHRSPPHPLQWWPRLRRPLGPGGSDWDKRYDLETTIGDIEFVRDAYGFDKAVIAGHSAGVGFSLAYALQYPNRTMGIIGISGGCLVDDRDWFKAYRTNLERHGEDNGGKAYTAAPGVNEIGNATWCDFIKGPTLLRDISRLGIPAVFINAGNDIRPNWPTVQLAHLLKHGEYVEIAGAGHYIWTTHPDELRSELRNAVAKIVAQQALPADADKPGR
jgi:pimeloyl-ACP methyl ester carboxylesterase